MSSFSGPYSALESWLNSIHQAITPSRNNAVAGATDPAISNPFYPMIMQAAQGDVLNNHVPRSTSAAFPMGGPGSFPVPSNLPPAMPTGGPGTFPTANNTPAAMPAGGPGTFPVPSNNVPPAVAQAQAQAGGGVPLPMARPAAAPQQMPWWQRNAASMRDPVTGAFIDPQAASRAQAQDGSSPSLIKKFAALLSNKAAAAPSSFNSNPYQNWGG